MRIRSLSLLGLFAIFVAHPCPAATGPAPEARERAAAVIVWSHIADHRDAIGAGVIVGWDGHRMRIVTARHVVAFGAITIWRDGRLYAGEIARTFTRRDVAVVDALVPPREAGSFAGIAVAAGVEPGQPVALWGEDRGGPRLERATIVTTHLQALGEPDPRDLVSLACATCEPGDSGAGVFDAQGRLVAILSARYNAPDGHAVAIVAEPIDAETYAFG